MQYAKREGRPQWYACFRRTKLGVARQKTSVGVTTQAFFLFKFQLQDMVLLFKTVLLPAYTVSNISFDQGRLII